MGIKRKILLGFITIGSLLFLSGVISTIELVRFNQLTTALIDLNSNNIELSKDMLDAVQEQNTALLMNITDSTHSHYSEQLRISEEQFAAALAKVVEKFDKSAELDRLYKTSGEYGELVKNVPDSLNVDWFSKVYKTSYYSLTNAIKEFMLSTQHKIIDYTAELKRNAYRATMVGIIALTAGFALLMLFYFMINNFFIKPVLTIEKSLGRLIKHNIPYTVEVITKDEIGTLNEDIKSLIEKNQPQ